MEVKVDKKATSITWRCLRTVDSQKGQKQKWPTDRTWNIAEGFFFYILAVVFHSPNFLLFLKKKMSKEIFIGKMFFFSFLLSTFITFRNLNLCRNVFCCDWLWSGGKYINTAKITAKSILMLTNRHCSVDKLLINIQTEFSFASYELQNFSISPPFAAISRYNLLVLFLQSVFVVFLLDHLPLSWRWEVGERRDEANKFLRRKYEKEINFRM